MFDLLQAHMVLVTKLVSLFDSLMRLIEHASQGNDVFVLIWVNHEVLVAADA